MDESTDMKPPVMNQSPGWYCNQCYYSTTSAYWAEHHQWRTEHQMRYINYRKSEC